MSSQQQTDQIEYSPLVFSVQPDWYSTPINEHFWMNCARYTAGKDLTNYYYNIFFSNKLKLQ
jgi:hypothetical protein